MTPYNDLVAEVSALRASGANEADTRFRVIDDVLTRVLGWSKDDIHCEERVSEDGNDQFLDYLIQTAQTSILIEAKRAKVNFGQLPETGRAKLKGSWLRGDLQRAVTQARDYGRKRSVGFCAVTNGDGWIIFPVNRRDLVPFEETYAVIFADAHSALDRDLDEFTQLLARQSVIDGSLDQHLLGSDSNQTENRRLNQIYDRSFSRVTRATMFASIEDELVTAFSEEVISDNPDLLEKSYVETADRIRFDDRVQMSVLRREHILQSRPLRPVGKGGVDKATRRIVETKVRPRPVALVTLGLVGAGKTTFLNYVEKISAKQYFHPKGRQLAHWIYVDFRNFSPTISPRDYIFDGIFEYVSKNDFLNDYDRCVRRAYDAEIRFLRKGPLATLAGDEASVAREIANILMTDYKEKAPYCTKIMSWAAGETPIFLVIDNVDQIESLETQASIFLESLAIARDSKLNLVLAMRDATYVRNKASAIFDAFDYDAIYIDPPAILSVLSKRFTIAQQILKGKSFDFRAEGGQFVTVHDASSVVELLSASVLSTEVGRLIEVTSTGDVRLALQMTRQFLQFGYSSSYRAYKAFKDTGRYRFPPHEALRVLMMGNQLIYRDDFSPILNPFDAKTGRSESQFLRLYIMGALVSAASTRAFQGLELNEIVDALEKMGFGQRTTEKVVKDLIRGRACFSRSHQDVNLDSVLAPTRLCGYIIRELLSRFVFIETTMMDTFVFDDVVWQKIREGMRKVYVEHNTVTRLKLRKECAQAFYAWIEREVQKLCDEAAKRNLGPFWTTNYMARMKTDFRSDLERAQGSAFRNYGTGNAAVDLTNDPSGLFYRRNGR